MKYYLGIDGGGTKTTYTVIDENEKVVTVTRSKGTAIDTYPLADVEKILVESIDALPYNFEGCFAGLAGITGKADIDVVNKMLAKAKNLKGAKISSGNDVVNAQRGTIPDGNGIILIVGTGSACYGVNGKYKHRVGGYCYKEGDAGSAYWIGSKALTYLTKTMDKRCPESSFSSALQESVKCFTWHQLAKMVAKANRADIATLAVVCTSCAHNSVAKSILDEGAAEIKAHVDTVYKQCKFKGKAKLAIVGSLGTAETYYKTAILEQLGSEKYEYIHGMHDAGLGAALLAKELE